MFDSHRSIAICLEAEGSPADRLKVNWMTTRATQHGDLPYRLGAVVPGDVWETLENKAIESLICDDPAAWPAQQLINIFRCPEPVLEAFRGTGLDGGTMEEIEAQFTAEAYADALERVSDHLTHWLRQPEFFRILGVCVQPGNLLTTTTHFDEDLQAQSWSGLHIDDWAGEIQSDPDHHVRQLSINLGATDRYFIFGKKLLRSRVSGLEKYQNAVKAYFSQGPAPLYRIRLQPGEVYIAPTDSIVHDGSTLGCAGPDVTFNLRGVFHKSFRQGHSL